MGNVLRLRNAGTGVKTRNPQPASASAAPRVRPWTIIAAVIAAVALLGAGVWIWASTSSASEAAPAGVLHQDTRMGAVDLAVADLPLMRTYYEDALGLDVLTEREDLVELGSGDTVLISLTNDAELDVADQSTAGLYHSAILYPDKAALAAVLQNVAETAPQTYQGSADHSVSLAFYLTDPEGNGVELYVDRPEEDWVWNDGRVTMGAEPLDPNRFIAENLTQEDGSESATVGHVHLRVGNLAAAQDFYADVIGFDITAEVPGALFMSAGGYHHHLAVNTWSSLDASDRVPTLGLGHFTVVLADAAELDAASTRIADAGLVAKTIDGGLAVNDPWGNTVHLHVA